MERVATPRRRVVVLLEELRRDASRPALLLPLSGGFIGLGTVANVVTILAGTTLGLLVGNRLPERAIRGLA